MKKTKQNHSPSVTDRNNRSKGQEGETTSYPKVVEKAIRAKPKDISLSSPSFFIPFDVNGLKEPSSFEKIAEHYVSPILHRDFLSDLNYYCLDKSIVERDYIEKQKVKDFLKNKREKWENSIDMSPYGIAREQQKLVLKELEKELMKE